MHLCAGHAVNLCGGDDHLVHDQLEPYLWPLIVLQTNEMKTIELVVASLATAYTPDYGLIMVANVLATFPQFWSSSCSSAALSKACWAASNR